MYAIYQYIYVNLTTVFCAEIIKATTILLLVSITILCDLEILFERKNVRFAYTIILTSVRYVNSLSYSKIPVLNPAGKGCTPHILKYCISRMLSSALSVS